MAETNTSVYILNIPHSLTCSQMHISPSDICTICIVHISYSTMHIYLTKMNQPIAATCLASPNLLQHSMQQCSFHLQGDAWPHNMGLYQEVTEADSFKNSDLISSPGGIKRKEEIMKIRLRVFVKIQLPSNTRQNMLRIWKSKSEVTSLNYDKPKLVRC